MSFISIIVAIDEKNGIGQGNKLLCHLPADLKYFKQTTMGKPIIMGRKTYDSIGKPLPGRKNIIISHDKTLTIDGAEVVDSLDKAIEKAKLDDEVMVIGGATIYQLALPKARRLYVTRIIHEFAADSFFPEIDTTRWHCINRDFRPKDETNSYDLCFETWEKNDQ